LQITVRPIRKPETTHSTDATQFVEKCEMTNSKIAAIGTWLDENGTKILTLMHGAEVYDVEGQNVCLSDCLTIDANTEDIRTLIFYSDGKIAYDWQYQGARFM
jgi:hypothetical protein